MNVLIFTSSMIDTDFADYQNAAQIKPNPSNQNFYSNLIKSISLKNHVSVISLRPFIKGMFKEKELEEEINNVGATTYYYTKVNGSKMNRFFHETNNITRVAISAIENFHSKEFIIITDTLRVSLLKAAKKISKLYGAKIVGMLTDNPNNLSFKNKTYVKTIKSLCESLDGYLSLTEKLANNLNPDKPNYVFEGLVSDFKYFKKDPIYDYYFFCGSLYERYGVKNLIDAYHETSIKSKLVIAGTGPLSKYIEQLSLEDYRILYLTQLPKERIIGYEKNAKANINPRPINKDLDKESVPSKLLEYLSSGVPTISTKFEKLYDAFRNDVFWIEGSSKEDIKTALETFEKVDQSEANKKALNAMSKAFEFYGIDVQAESITHFLTIVNSSNN